MLRIITNEFLFIHLILARMDDFQCVARQQSVAVGGKFYGRPK